MTRRLLFLVLALLGLTCLAACAGMTPSQTVAAVGGAAGGIAASLNTFIDSLAPMLPPEKVASLHAIVASVGDGVQAVAQLGGSIANEIAHVRDIAAQAQQTANGALTPGTLTAYGLGGAGTLGVAMKIAHGAGTKAGSASAPTPPST
jgi:hypothetical protein